LVPSSNLAHTHSSDNADVERMEESKAKKKTVRQPWTDGQQSAVRSSLAKYFFMTRLPGKQEIEQCLQKHACLANRTWRNVKDYIQNYQKKCD